MPCISNHHPEHRQPSWNVRTALVALIAFMHTNPYGALGSLHYPKEEQRVLAIKSREGSPKFGTAERQKLIDEIHDYMLSKAPPVPEIIQQGEEDHQECEVASETPQDKTTTVTTGEPSNAGSDSDRTPAQPAKEPANETVNAPPPPNIPRETRQLPAHNLHQPLPYPNHAQQGFRDKLMIHLLTKLMLEKSSKELNGKAAVDQECSRESCSYHKIGNVFVCEKTGNVHGKISSPILRYCKTNEA